MKSFNLSEWALEHRAFTGFIMGLILLGGIIAYFGLEQREDPKFTFRLMVVKTLYPGATAQEVEQQLTDKLEKKIPGTAEPGLLAQLLQTRRIGYFHHAARSDSAG